VTTQTFGRRSGGGRYDNGWGTQARTTSTDPLCEAIATSPSSAACSSSTGLADGNTALTSLTGLENLPAGNALSTGYNNEKNNGQDH
jgi:hypothetical protein